MSITSEHVTPSSKKKANHSTLNHYGINSQYFFSPNNISPWSTKNYPERYASLFEPALRVHSMKSLEAYIQVNSSAIQVKSNLASGKSKLQSIFSVIICSSDICGLSLVETESINPDRNKGEAESASYHTNNENPRTEQISISLSPDDSKDEDADDRIKKHQDSSTAEKSSLT